MNCSMFDSGHGVCNSQTTEPVENHSASNFCEEFRFAFRAGRARETDALTKASEARRRWESLFKK
jgi:hypothetical protein